jgi:hypothetical protein
VIEGHAKWTQRYEQGAEKVGKLEKHPGNYLLVWSKKIHYRILIRSAPELGEFKPRSHTSFLHDSF